MSESPHRIQYPTASRGMVEQCRNSSHESLAIWKVLQRFTCNRWPWRNYIVGIPSQYRDRKLCFFVSQTSTTRSPIIHIRVSSVICISQLGPYHSVGTKDSNNIRAKIVSLADSNCRGVTMVMIENTALFYVLSVYCLLRSKCFGSTSELVHKLVEVLTLYNNTTV